MAYKVTSICVYIWVMEVQLHYYVSWDLNARQMSVLRFDNCLPGAIFLLHNEYEAGRALD